MTTFRFFAAAKPPSPPFDDDRAAAFEVELAGSSLMTDDAAAPVLKSLAGHSPFLARIVERDAELLEPLLRLDPDAAFAEVLRAMQASACEAKTSAEVQKPLRVARRHVAVLVGLADITGQWAVPRATRALSDFADAATAVAVEALLRIQLAKGKLTCSHSGDISKGLGLTVLAMGKFGARELNYSSDIDIVVFFDHEILGAKTADDPQSFAIRLTRDLVSVLHEPTRDGYVFRVDLRLRPDAGSTQVAISTTAAESYYEAFGQNWERAAFIKARPVAGDIALGEVFLEMLTPFVWRKYLDFAAIEDIYSILRQIHSHGRHRDIEVEGHDVKLGLGGIREIEFFVQTQQLIHGGRRPELRGRRTLDMLAELAAQGDIASDTCDRLSGAYEFLRLVEHRLQMIEDQQTHSLPKAAEQVARIASFCGYQEEAIFRADLVRHLNSVHEITRGLFDGGGELGGAEGRLVFTGVENDDETLETLRKLGFTRADDVSASIRKWHLGKLRATRSTRSRARLTELMPKLLEALSATADPDRAFFRFDDFLRGLPAGIQFFSLLIAHPEVLHFFAKIFGMAPRLSNYLARHSHLIDALLDDEFTKRLPAAEEIEAAFSDAESEALLGTEDPDLEDMMNLTRRLVRELNFQIGVQLLEGNADHHGVGIAYTAVAEAAIRALLRAVEAEFRTAHGQVASGRFVVLALGRLGSGEMTSTSDLDLIFVYDHAGQGKSDGARGLEPATYFARLGQRLVNAISAPTEEGKLFEVDMRLRPSGNKGPLATRLESFRTYHAESAWTWERMALTRARVVAGDASLAGEVQSIIEDALAEKRDPAKVKADIVEMRDRLDREFGTENPWGLKFVRGGLMDVEFVAQGLQLLHAHGHPAIRTVDTAGSIQAAAKARVIDETTATTLGEAFDFYLSFDHILRLAVEGDFLPDAAPGPLIALLEKVGGKPFGDLDREVRAKEQSVIRIFDKVLGPD